MLRFNLILVIFLLLLGTVYTVAWNLEGKEANKARTELVNRVSPSPHHFYYADYFSQKNGRPWLFLNAEELIIDGDRNIQTVNPQGRFYQLKKGAVNEEAEEIPLNYRALFGKYVNHERYLRLVGQVELWQQSATMERSFKSHQAVYLLEQKKIEAEGKVQSFFQSLDPKQKIFIAAESMRGYPESEQFTFWNKVNGEIRPERAYQAPIWFNSERLEADMKQGLVVLYEQVRLRKQEVNASSRKAEIFLSNQNKKLKYYVLYDDIKIVQKVKGQDGNTLVREAFSEKLEGFALEQKLVLTGAPKVYQGKDSVRGNVITLRENAELIEVDNSNSVIEVKSNN